MVWSGSPIWDGSLHRQDGRRTEYPVNQPTAPSDGRPDLLSTISEPPVGEFKPWPPGTHCETWLAPNVPLPSPGPAWLVPGLADKYSRSRDTPNYSKLSTPGDYQYRESRYGRFGSPPTLVAGAPVTSVVICRATRRVNIAIE